MAQSLDTDIKIMAWMFCRYCGDELKEIKQAYVCEPCKKIPGLNKYGINRKQYERMLRQQKGCCAICKSTVTKRRLAVDHDHTTGKVRGLLCMNCNMGLGFFQDDEDIMANAIAYIKNNG